MKNCRNGIDCKNTKCKFTHPKDRSPPQAPHKKGCHAPVQISEPRSLKNAFDDASLPSDEEVLVAIEEAAEAEEDKIVAILADIDADEEAAIAAEFAGTGLDADEEEDQGKYRETLDLIQENRRKNEAKRAAQSARNAEIIAAFEKRCN